MQVLRNLALLAAGSSLCALAVNGVLIPHQFLSGGFVGLSLIVHYAFPALSLGTLYLLFNIPLFCLAWRYVARRFFLYSIAGLLLFTLAVELVNVRLPVQDRILAALLAGIVNGVGSGIILRSLGSAGGTDILSVMLLQRFSIRLGTTSLAFNTAVLATAAVLFSLEGALYTLIYIYVNAQLVQIVVTGWSQRKAVFIISPQWGRIHEGILKEIRRGVTIIQGKGGYAGGTHQILYTVITFRELPRLKRLVRGIDPTAFVVITDTMEVMGQRIGNQPHR